MRSLLVCLLVVPLLVSACGGDEQTTAAPAGPATSAASAGVLEGTLPLLDGREVDLAGYHGHPVLVVNTASHCGFTPQYEGLQALYDRYRERGLVVLGFPANDFNQEPGTNDEIADVCQLNYGVTFPVFAKVTVLGDAAPAIYRGLAAAPAPVGGAPTWNFTKFLLDAEGRPVARFEPGVEPGDPEVVAAVEQLLPAT